MAAATDETITKVCEMVHEEAKNLIDGFHRFYIALYDSSNSTISFPLVMIGNQRLTYKPRDFQINSLPDFSINKRKTIRANHSDFYGKGGSKKFAYWPEEDGPPVSMICSPVLTGDKTVGALVIEKRFGEEELTEGAARLLDELSQLSAVSIDRIRLYEGLKEKNEQLEKKTKAQEAVHDIGVKLTEGIQLGEEKILKIIKEHADRVMDTNNMYIALYEPDPSIPDVFDPDQPENCHVHGTVKFGLMYIDGRPKDMPARKAEPGKYGRTEFIIATREKILIQNMIESEEWYKQPGHANFLPGKGEKEKESFASWVGVPMIASEKPIGVIATFHRETEHLYNKDDQQVLSMMANQAATAIENARLFKIQIHQKKELESASHKIAETQDALTRTLFAADIIHRLNNLVGTIPIWSDSLKNEVEELANRAKEDMLNVIFGIKNAIYESKDGRTKAEKDDIISRIKSLSETILINADLISDSVEKLTTNISDDVNELLREIERLKKPPREEILNVNAILDAITNRIETQYRAEIKKGALKITKQIVPELYNIWGLYASVLDALMNVISNSIDSILENTGLGILELDAMNYLDENSNDWIRIVVSDNGKGIPENIVDKVFEPFFTTKENGLGYGLWRAKSIIENLGGKIELHAPPESGAKFTIYIPKAKEQFHVSTSQKGASCR